MHIEPGLIAPAKLTLAAAVAAPLVLAHLPPLFKQPALLLRTLLAALFFSLFMQAFHMKVGPSELHFLGAMPLYLSFGFVPTLLGLPLGLLLQGLVFEPQDLVHLAVNSLSLMLPLMAVHHGLARRLVHGERSVTVKTLLQLDSAYYGGVIAMVGFWLAMGQGDTSLAEWARFAVAYAPVVLLEPLVTLGTLWLLRADGPLRRLPLAAQCFAPQPGRA
ncbi:MAG: cobalamin biosynthesis protein CbiM [Burkholderiales bacterium PBB2]|nr:MAG: cobalamin biosynthesis protein CbiM [Burkholderiales bacterium PBB2]